MNPWKTLLFLALACLFIAYGMVLVAQRRAGEVDRKFLDEVISQQDQATQTPPATRINAASEIPTRSATVPRAELVVNSAIVKRGELVVRVGVVTHSRPSITTSRQNSQAAAESGRRLN